MARVTKVEGTVRVSTETGGSFSLTVTGHGMKDGQSILELGPYLGKLVTAELLKVLSDVPRAPAQPPDELPPAQPSKPIPVRVADPPLTPPPQRRPKGASRG